LKPTTNKTDCVTYPVGKKAGHLNTS